MTKTNQLPRTPQRSWSRAWFMVMLAFSALTMGAVAFDQDQALAQAPKAKAKTKAEPSRKTKNLPVAKSLTAGVKIDGAALTRLIDQEINKRITQEKAKSSGLCDDAEFARRVYLDLVGVIPTGEKLAAFLASKDANKRAKLIDELLADSRFGSHVAEQWANVMIPRESNNRLLNSKPLEAWLADHFNKNTPLNKTVYSLITASGPVGENPAGVYFVGNPTVDKITDNVTRVFLGVQLQCAQCHNHPFTDWKQTEYWAMASFFMKTRMSATPQQAAKKGKALIVSEVNTGKGRGKKGGLPASAKIVPAKFLQGESPKLNTSEPYRPVLAKWMTSPDNKFFARAMVNRFWYQLFGRGIVNPVDDMHDDNTATHPELLATMTEQFKLNSFDVKFLVRAICNSQVYQRSSHTVADADSVDHELYAQRQMRVMSPGQMYDSLTTILGAVKGKAGAKTKKQPKKGPASPRDAFITFFRVEEGNPLEYQSGIPQALRMMNSPFTNRAEFIAADITRAAKTPAEAIERIYLAAVSRRPTAAELERLTTYARRPGSTPRTAYGDILWALLNTSEFVLNH
ncbi:MAG: DUF1553 domain-containing protein [Planctomycetes bacterium]|nr:DUF1553 domain-containing protein [Planctomycetota bacterium]